MKKFNNIFNKKSELYSSLSALLNPYLEYWVEWTESYQCFLREDEKELLNLWMSLKNPKLICGIMNLSESRINLKFQRISNKIRCNKDKFHDWLEENDRIQNGIIPEPTPKEKFLKADFAYHPISRKLYYLLQYSTCLNMEEFLSEYYHEEIIKLRGFGKKSLIELVELLKQNNCLELLRKDRIIQRFDILL